MEAFEQKWVKVYAARLAAAEGNLSKLPKDQRQHLRLLMRKHELEQQSLEIDKSLSQPILL